MGESRSTSLLSGPRLLAALALTATLTAVGLTAARSAEGAVPGIGMVPGMATVNPSTWTGSGTPVPTVPASPAPSSAGPSQSPLAPPTNVTVTRVTATSITLTWTAPVRGQATGYSISYVNPFSDVPGGTTVGNVTTATVTQGVSPATQYRVTVGAFDAAGHWASSTESIVIVTPLSDTGVDTVPPSAPGTLNATRLSTGELALSWGPSTDNVGVTGYNVYWFDGWYQNRLLATVTGTSYSTTFVGGSSTGINSYYVRARDAAGNVSIATNRVFGGASGSPTASPSTPPVPPSPSASTPVPVCRIIYRSTAQWRNEFTADVTITNTGKTAYDGWALAFSFGGDQRIRTTWNSTFSQTGADVTLRNTRWNGRVAPGQTVTVGLLGARSATDTSPTQFTLNGQNCWVV